MSRLFGRPERRSWTSVSPIPPNSLTGYGGTSFARVDLTRADASLQKVAVWACVNLTRTIVEMLPAGTYTGQGKDRKAVSTPGWLDNIGGDGFGLADWCSQVVYSEMLRGNAIGLVGERDQRNGSPRLIALQHPDAVSAWKDPGTGAVEWRIEGKVVATDRIWHRRVNGTPGQILGMSPVAMHALTIGVGIQALRFGQQWFEDGAHPSGLLSTDKPLQAGQADTAKQRFLAALRGKREPLVLGGGWKYQAIQIAPGESQFLETNHFTSAECCRIFGPAFAEVFGYETGGNLTYANVEQRSLDLLTYAVDPYLVRVERMISDLLPSNTYFQFNRGALLRTDLVTRYQAYEIALRNRFAVVNEVRDLEDRESVAWGDEPNFTTYTFNERVTPTPPDAPVDGPPTGGQ